MIEYKPKSPHQCLKCISMSQLGTSSAQSSEHRDSSGGWQPRSLCCRPGVSINNALSNQQGREGSLILLNFKNVIILQSIQYWNNHSCWPAAHCLASAGPFSIYRSKWFSIEAARLRGHATCNLREVWSVIITEKALSWLKAATTSLTF